MLQRSLWVVSIVVASMLGAIFGPAVASAVLPNGSTSPGDGLVFVPVEPCKVFAGIKLDGADMNDVATVDMTAVPNSTGQNQDPCAQTAAPAGAAAVSLNLIAQSAKARGNLQIGPSGGTTESLVNYVNTVDMNNSTELTVSVDSNGQLDLQAGGSGTNGIADVITAKGVLLGYYVPGDSLYESFDRTLVVSGSGTDTENGAALQAAVANVNSQVPTGANPWLIKLEPGTYDLELSRIILANGVNLEGSGIPATTITSGLSELVTISSDSTSLSDLTVRSTGTAFAAAIRFRGGGLVHNVHAIGTQAAIYFEPTGGLDIQVNGLIAQPTSTAADLDTVLLSLNSVGSVFITNSQILGTESTDGGIRDNSGTADITIVNTFIEDTTSASNAGVICRAISNPTTFLPTTCS